MIIVEACSVDYVDDVIPPITRGAIRSNGRSVLVSEWDEVQKRMRQVDRLTDASITTPDKEGVVKITGRSTYLLDIIGLPQGECEVTISVKPLVPARQS